MADIYERQSAKVSSVPFCDSEMRVRTALLRTQCERAVTIKWCKRRRVVNNLRQLHSVVHGEASRISLERVHPVEYKIQIS